jgi:hypothetical protein
MKTRCQHLALLALLGPLSACLMPPGAYAPAYGRGFGPDQGTAGQAQYAGHYAQPNGQMVPGAFAPQGHYGQVQPQPGGAYPPQGAANAGQFGTPWPNNSAQVPTGFGTGLDPAAEAQQRSEVFGAMPDVRLGSSRAVEPGSTGLSRGLTGADSQALEPQRAVPFSTDGGATQAPTQGSLQALDAPTRQLPEAVQSRSLLIDDYSKALDERDALRRENQALSDQIKDLEVRLLAAEQGLGAGVGQARELEQRTESLEYQLERSEQERADLEARLVTAQIRRLEAEQSLLEAWIEAERWRAQAGPSSLAAPIKPTGSVSPAPAVNQPPEVPKATGSEPASPGSQP